MSKLKLVGKINNEAIVKLNQTRVEVANLEERIRNKQEEEKQTQVKLTQFLQELEAVQSKLRIAQDQQREHSDLTDQIESKKEELAKCVENNKTAIINSKVRLQNECQSLEQLREGLIVKVKQVENELFLKGIEKKEVVEKIALLEKEYQQKIREGEGALASLKASFQDEQNRINQERTLIRKEREALIREQESIARAEEMITMFAQKNGVGLKWNEEK